MVQEISKLWKANVRRKDDMQYHKLTQSFTTGEVKARGESKVRLSFAL